MNLKKVALGLVVVSLALGVNQGFNVFSTSQSSGQNNKKMDNSNSIENIRIDDSLYQPKTNWGVYREKIEVKGIFLTAGSLATTSSLDYLLGIVNDTEINSMVIDVKNDAGTLTYESSAGIKMGIDSKYVMNYERFLGKMETLLDNDVYPIARIVTFKDRQAGAKRPDIVFKDKNGNVWRDNNGNTWLNPFNKESWEYPIRLAEEAALNGFKEIQFDYVRFPTDGNTSIIDYGNIQGKTKEDAIAEFLSYAKERLEPLGVYVSADVFGHIINVQGGAGIGQDIDMLATSTDILSPMVYPSHYNKGSYGVAYPDADPYTIVNEAMKRAINRVNGAEGEKDDKAIIRPWLQDFSATWLRNSYGSHYTPYGPEQVRAQIQATYDAGLKEWILWNASNRYTLGALYNEDGTGGYTYDPNAAKATFKPKNTDNKSTKQEDTKQEDTKQEDTKQEDT
ncbi:putative glycoside hydrolase, partial [Sporosalibacterium faouarense]|uniref:putative glycoside hydrolase n=1 Tax=Sporosalibacterium faouarense TaxID=516123 RepID=UPI00192C7B28